MRRYTIEVRGKEYVIDVEELTADSFEVVVGDQTYTVTLAGDEDVAESAITPDLRPAPATGTPATAPGTTVVARPARKAAMSPAVAVKPKPGAGGAASLNAPMPGVVIEIAVKPGDAVTRGQLVAILDAMKMHNNIRSPRAGTIREVCVDAGQAVGHGDPIVRFEEG